MTWTEAAHPRNPSGPAGGEFATDTTKPTAKPAAKPVSKKPGAHKRTDTAHGSMSFNGRTGTGYGSKNGDARVKKLQTMLNKLHLTDAHGKALAVDGKLGPLTTQAVKKWQAKNGIKPANGVVTPAMLAKAHAPVHKRAHLAKPKPLKPKAKTTVKPNVPPVRPKPY